MAYEPNQLLTHDESINPQKRAYSFQTNPKTLAPGSGVVEPLTPLAFNTSTNKWVVWSHNGSNGTGTILGFLWPDPVTLHSTLDVIGQVMLQGRVHFEDIVLPYGQSESNLKAALRSGPQARGLEIQGLDQVR